MNYQDARSYLFDKRGHSVGDYVSILWSRVLHRPAEELVERGRVDLLVCLRELAVWIKVRPDAESPRDKEILFAGRWGNSGSHGAIAGAARRG